MRPELAETGPGAAVGEVLTRAIDRLRASGSESARLDAELLVAHALGIERTGVLAHPEVSLPPSAAARLEGYLGRRERGEPVAYIRGIKEFHALAFTVDQRALIPRPETELLVDLGVSRAAAALTSGPQGWTGGRYRIVDVGTGSGAVAIAAAAALRARRFLPAVEIVATDCSADALELAVENAVAHGLADTIRFLRTDLLPGDEPAFDLVLANLPYVASDEVPRLPRAASFEPGLALDGGPDGLAVIRRLLARLPEALRPMGVALLEIGAAQEAPLRAVMQVELAGWEPEFHVDLAGVPRVAELRATFP
ncbi:MAG: peptide chain release factor N(5)-glutamine methyltransferase [Candidatus Limnocylindrales bacterium]